MIQPLTSPGEEQEAFPHPKPEQEIKSPLKFLAASAIKNAGFSVN